MEPPDSCLSYLHICDHTLLSTTATWEKIQALCDEGIEYGVASVCIPPCFVRLAKTYVGDALKICTVIGFPNGYNSTETKVFETKQAIEDGADEVDMVIHVGELLAGNDDYVLDEVRQVREASAGKILKVIIETCLLSDEEKIRACRIVTEAGADFIKTSTGFSTGGATVHDVRLLRENVGEGVKVKAAGGISSFEDAKALVEAGAERLGTSRLVKLAKEQEKK
ncbi:MAG: deoxyribose-phosphate aldolase [Clostridia bacterium]|nr:deoxyribose-phosphate aldolase [Clostridia bacterium]